jgi:predicted acylesterase/phospholipase RssA
MEGVKYMVFSGGSTKAYFYVGGLRYIEEKWPGSMEQIDTFVGSSVGAIISFFCCMGNGSKEILNLMNDINQQYGCFKMDVDQVLDILEKLGLDNGEILTRVMRGLLEKQFDRTSVTFAQLKEWLGKNLCISAFNATKKRTDFFAPDTTPHMDVIDAIRASFAIPIIFTPITINNDIYVDGSILDHFPVSYLIERKINPQEVLGFVIELSKVEINNSPSLLTLLYSMINFLFSKINELENKISMFPNVVSFSAEDTEFFVDMERMCIKSPSDETIKNLIDIGYTITKKEFRRHTEKRKDVNSNDNEHNSGTSVHHTLCDNVGKEM